LAHVICSPVGLSGVAFLLVVLEMMTATEPANIERLAVIVVMGVYLDGAAYFAGLTNQFSSRDCPVHLLVDYRSGLTLRRVTVLRAAVEALFSAAMRSHGRTALAFSGWCLASHWLLSDPMERHYAKSYKPAS
jgi:hypothetical protein